MDDSPLPSPLPAAGAAAVRWAADELDRWSRRVRELAEPVAAAGSGTSTVAAQLASEWAGPAARRGTAELAAIAAALRAAAREVEQLAAEVAALARAAEPVGP